MFVRWDYGAALFAVALLHGAPAASAASQSYPSKPVRIVVPSAPGGGTDIAARTLAPQLARILRGEVVVDNRPGPSGNVAAEAVVKALADGYTLLLATSILAINPPVTPKPAYAPEKDFVPVGAVTAAPLVLLVQPPLPAKSVRDLVAMAKAQPGKLRYAHAGFGSAERLCGELFVKAAGIRASGAAYKDDVLPEDAALGPDVQYAFAGIARALPRVKTGQARMLAVTTARRYVLLPDVPTVSETVHGFEFPGWQALFAPARTPAAVLRHIETAVLKAMDTKPVTENLTAHGLQPVPAANEELRTFLPRQIAQWRTLLREANFKAK
jgi:tripartite-type tricarboxylate transporter receptor subunit TctC